MKIESDCLGDVSSFDAGMACQGLMAFYGKGMFGYPQDQAKSDELFDRMKMHWVHACKAGEIEACSSLGNLNAIKLRSLPPASEKAAIWASATIPWLDRACRGGDALSCDALADIYEVGRGVPKDLTKASEVRGLARKANGGAP